MLVHRFNKKTQGEYTFFSAKFEFLSKSINAVIWFKIKTEFCKNCYFEDAFFSAAYPLAMAVNEDCFLTHGYRKNCLPISTKYIKILMWG